VEVLADGTGIPAVSRATTAPLAADESATSERLGSSPAPTTDSSASYVEPTSDNVCKKLCTPTS